MNAGIVLQSFMYTNQYLSGKTVMNGINRGTNNCGETGIDENLAAYNNKNSGFFWILDERVSNPIEVSPFHKST
jgi:hypothetical protein